MSGKDKPSEATEFENFQKVLEQALFVLEEARRLRAEEEGSKLEFSGPGLDCQRSENLLSVDDCLRSIFQQFVANSLALALLMERLV